MGHDGSRLVCYLKVKQSVGSVVQRIQTFDPDTGVGGIVRFFVHGEKFSIENERCSNSYCHADLVLKSPLDYESNPIERVTIVARDGASLTKHANEARANVTINIIDEQDTPPTFLTTLTEPVRILESVPIGTKVLQVNAVDGDRYAPRKNEILYEIVGKNDYFQIDSVHGAITLIKQLDREVDPKLALTIVATEQDDARMSSEMTFEIIVEDADDNAPQCSTQQYTANLNRTSKTFEMDKIITVLDKDQGKNAQFNIALSGEFSESFEIKPKKAHGSAEITVEVVDYDSLEYVTDSKIVLEIKLDPRGSKPSTPSSCLLVIHLDKLLPKKAVPPFKFLKNVYNIQLMENLSPPQIVANLTNFNNIHDVEFMIEGNGTQLFSINNNSQFMTTEVLDAEKARNYKIKVYANSKDYTVTADINIDVLDENDNAPIFEKSHYIFNVTEEQDAAFYVKVF
uniref:Cadherin domain-containing protein n=1 Tax=Panagrolaimus sp. ES5 TaxID=591445 RepID=A0AC34FP04_9BILA